MKILFRSNNFEKKLFITLIFIICLLLIIFFKGKKEMGDFSYHQSLWNQYSVYIDKVEMKDDTKINLKHVYGGIVSHDIPTTIPELVAFYFKLKQSQEIKKIIIIAPDHNNAGIASVSVSNTAFYTHYGRIEAIPRLPALLEERKVAKIYEPPYEKEHSIGSQMLVISKIFPDINVTPIVLRSNTTKEEAQDLAQSLASYIDESTILIASVDFSHYLSSEQSNMIDNVSKSILENLDTKSLPLLKADSNKSLEVFMDVMSKLGAKDSANVRVLNTRDFGPISDYTTGYVFGYWGKK